MLKRFLISSKNYAGHAEIVYNGDVLHALNFAECNMNAAQRKSFKEAVPVGLHRLEEFVKHYNLVAVDVEYEVSFTDFWDGYAKKINRQRSEKLWQKISKTEQVLCVAGLPAYHAYRQRLNKYQYDPDTYLREKMWKNEWQKINN